MSLVYDLFCVLILAVSVVIGYRRGAVKTILLVLAFLIAALGAWYLSQAAAPTVYRAFVKDHVVSAAEKSLDQENLTGIVNRIIQNAAGTSDVELSGEELKTAAAKSGDLSENLAALAKQKGYTGSQQVLAEQIQIGLNAKQVLLDSDTAENLPETVQDILEKSSDDIESDVRAVLVEAADGTTKSAAAAVEEHLLRTPIISLIRTILAIGIFVILLALLRILISFTGVINKVPFAGTINRLGGGVLGFVYGVVILMILASLVSLLIKNGIAADYLNEKSAENTKIFQYFYQYCF